MATEMTARTRAPGIQLRANVCPVVIEHAAGQLVDGLAAQDQVGREEADVHRDRDRHHKQRAEVAELGPARCSYGLPC
jgi:hypothetical protein